MKANELRVGNWIQSETGRPVQVLSIYGDRFNIEFVHGETYSSPLSEAEGIPLTWQVLESLGFEFKGPDIVKEGSRIRLQKSWVNSFETSEKNETQSDSVCETGIMIGPRVL